MAGTLSGREPDHIPVLLDEVLENLVQSRAGIYVDATFGRGGHSCALLEVVGLKARVIAMDRDPEAVAVGEKLAAQDARLSVRQAKLSELQEALGDIGVRRVTGVLMDLGVSSPQLDDAERGFSFRMQGPLDMRMNPLEGRPAADWLNSAAEEDIARVLKEYGEERHARRIAKAIVAVRPINTTTELADIVADAVPVRSRPGKHPATKTFQAVRIFVNDEMTELRKGLIAAFEVLEVGGRLAVISFHSLEDRLVKQSFRSLTRPPAMPRRVPVRQADMVTRARDIAGPIRPGVKELNDNPRARSAILRVIEKSGPAPSGVC